MLGLCWLIDHVVVLVVSEVVEAAWRLKEAGMAMQEWSTVDLACKTLFPVDVAVTVSYHYEVQVGDWTQTTR